MKTDGEICKNLLSGPLLLGAKSIAQFSFHLMR